MSDNDNNKCPLCGKDTHNDELFCRNCQEIAKNSYSEDWLAQEEANTAQEEKDNIDTEDRSPEEKPSEELADTPPIKSNKKTWIFVAITIFILIGAGIFSAQAIRQGKNSIETEKAYWKECVERNTPLDYSKYLVCYPDGQYSEEAYNRIKELRENERKEWQNLRNSNDVDALLIYLANNPQSPYKEEIQHDIDSLAWINTSAQNTADAYQAYLDNVKIERYLGKHISQAQERYDYLSQLKILEGENLEEVKKTLKSFFQAFSSENKNEFQKMVTDTLTRFYAVYNQPERKIIDSVKADYKKNKIRSIVYTPVTDSIEAILDNKGICFITLPVRAETTFTNRRQKKESTTYNVKMELTDKKLVSTLYRKE